MSRPEPPILAVLAYFGAGAAPNVAQTFTPGAGWRRCEPPIALTHAHARGLRRRGVTAVAPQHAGRVADFRVDELLGVDRRPLRCGELIGSPRRIAAGARDGGRG